MIYFSVMLVVCQNNYSHVSQVTIMTVHLTNENAQILYNPHFLVSFPTPSPGNSDNQKDTIKAEYWLVEIEVLTCRRSYIDCVNVIAYLLQEKEYY